MSVADGFNEGDVVRFPGTSAWVTVQGAMPRQGGWRLFFTDAAGETGMRDLTGAEAGSVARLVQDGAAPAERVLAGLWAQWMARATTGASAAAMASTPLVPYPHQNRAVYGAMLPQPLLRFLLADEPGTGKTIMAGLWLREMQRLGFVKRALIVGPAHLGSKWQKDFERFFGGGLRRITNQTIRQDALSAGHDLWYVSIELAAVNPSVVDAIDPRKAGWDAVVFDEAHRLTPTAQSYWRVGRLLAKHTPRALLMTATPHRGNERLFRALMHLVDPSVFPEVDGLDDDDEQVSRLRPGPLHFLRRMKEELVDYDGRTRLFLGRLAENVAVPLSPVELGYYNRALDLVDAYFPASSTTLAKMVYGKRAASSLFALAETLERRAKGMNSGHERDDASDDPYDDDDAERDERAVVAEASKASKEERKAIGELLKDVRATLADAAYEPSKWPKVKARCLEPNGIRPGAGRQVVVFTEFADTADWLVSKFRSEGFSAERYSGRDTHAARDLVRDRFAAREFEVLVSTDAGNEGIDLQTAQTLLNWDIPWSLVRLEQRMGRIHRVGQTSEVHLYNVIATDTREGEAHLKLLDNLVNAANELGGKMFDSLALVGDAALAEAHLDSLEQLLKRTYEDEAHGSAEAVKAVRAITKERLRQLHDAERAAEDWLKVGVDLHAAVTALHDERLERINPHIVERFLTRTAGAGLVSVERSAIADEGLWLLRADGLGNLPGGLPVDSDDRCLIATSGQAKRDAVAAGQARAGQAVSLGPAEPAFRSLVDTVSDQLGADLWQGGHLNDPTTITDYDLFVYAADITEGDGRRNTRWSWLVRVDQVGARTVPWEILANLTAGAPQPKAPHPARQSDATTRAASELAADLTKRRKSLTEWLTEARTQLERLPNDLTDDIDDDATRKSLRDRITAAVEHRARELERAVTINAGDLRLLGWAHVTATGVPEQHTAKDSELIAMKSVTARLRADGWAVADVHAEKVGFDLHARRGRDQRCVEVKGIWDSASSAGITLTGNELAKAGLLGNDYWLYVVDHCSDGAGVLYSSWQNPAAVFADAAKDVPVLRINGSDLAAAKEHHTP